MFIVSIKSDDKHTNICNKRGKVVREKFGNRLLKSKQIPDGDFKMNHLLIWELNKRFDFFTGS